MEGRKNFCWLSYGSLDNQTVNVGGLITKHLRLNNYFRLDDALILISSWLFEFPTLLISLDETATVQSAGGDLLLVELLRVGFSFLSEDVLTVGSQDSAISMIGGQFSVPDNSYILGLTSEHIYRPVCVRSHVFSKDERAWLLSLGVVIDGMYGKFEITGDLSGGPVFLCAYDYDADSKQALEAFAQQNTSVHYHNSFFSHVITLQGRKIASLVVLSLSTNLALYTFNLTVRWSRLRFQQLGLLTPDQYRQIKAAVALAASSKFGYSFEKADGFTGWAVFAFGRVPIDVSGHLVWSLLSPDFSYSLFIGWSKGQNWHHFIDYYCAVETARCLNHSLNLCFPDSYFDQAQVYIQRFHPHHVGDLFIQAHINELPVTFR